MLLLLAVSFNLPAQQLDVTITNTGGNKIRIEGTPTAPGFDTPGSDSWTSMNLTWRIPKGIATPAPTVAPPAATPEVTGETTAFTGAAPRSLFTNTLELAIFDVTAFGLPDDGFWYFQITGTVDNTQSISAGSSVVLYEFTLPLTWVCAACVEILTADIPGLPISTASFIDNAGTGTNVLNIVTNNATLPVRFISFEVSRKDDGAKLDWKVSNETNVNGYFVERSADGVSWKTIGFVSFQSTSAAINNYSFTDNSPENALNYYRIRQQDIDGRVKYSVIRTIRMDVNGMQVKLYPVPVKNVLSINIQSTIDGPGNIRIMDAVGHTIREFKMQLRKGGQTEELQVGDIKPGTYYIQIHVKDFIWTRKIIKD